MPLTEYRRKRDFKLSPEPAVEKSGRETVASSGDMYVIQEHHARRLHYDLRLELNGVLKSWAVPKGPSEDPKVKRLAVEVEDHPLEYGSFQGEIPKGQYGAGTVTIWDHGHWQPTSDPSVALKKGHLNFNVFGEKLHGNWNLVRTNQQRSGKNQWLLIKGHDNGHDDGHDKDHDVNVGFELATLVKVPPTGDKWIHETKFDGYRTICLLDGKNVHYFSRSLLDWTAKYQNLSNAILKFAKKNKLQQALFDGEIVALDKRGISSFSLLQESLKSQPAKNLIYYIFDVLFINRKDIRDEPLSERRKILESLRSPAKTIRISPRLHGSGIDLLNKICAQELEGVVSKDLTQPYRAIRSNSWLKIKCHLGQEFVIVGYTDPGGTRTGFGSLLLAAKENGKDNEKENGQWRYVGRVGTGFDELLLRDLKSKFKSLERDQSPLITIPADANAKDVHWLEPQLLAEVEFRGWPHDKLLRQASFKGLRLDKPADSIVIEHATENGASNENDIPLTHPDKVLLTRPNVTKREIFDYFNTVSALILPYIANRPLALVRCPNGIDAPCFFQKNLDVQTESTKHIYTRRIAGPDGDPASFIYLDNKLGLMKLCQLATLEIHRWGTHQDHPLQPDDLVFDVDPDPSLPWRYVVEAAFELKSILERLKLISFVKLTGGKGVHVHAPIEPHHTWQQIKDFTHATALFLEEQNPDRYISVMTKAKRAKKIFVDYLRNGYGATSIAPYSTRARPGARIAVPVSWQELRHVHPEELNLEWARRTLPKRHDPWREYFNLRQKFPAFL